MAMSEIKGVYLCPAAATPPGHWLGYAWQLYKRGGRLKSQIFTTTVQ